MGDVTQEEQERLGGHDYSGDFGKEESGMVVEETGSGLVKVTDRRGEGANEHPRDPVLSLLRKLDELLSVWLPQQEEWALIIGGLPHVSRRQLYLRFARAIAKRMTTIPHANRFV